MTFNGWAQIVVFCAVIILITKPLGGYMTRVFAGERTLFSPVLGPVERGIYALAGIDEQQEQHWLSYTLAIMLFHIGGFIIMYALLRLQGLLPFNPAGQGPVEQGLAFNTAASFITNTNWQAYGGESTLSYLTQMLGMTHQNFLSAAAGVAIAVAIIRGFARASIRTVGSFWVDVTRCTLYVLLPICIVYALFLVWQGIPQTLGAYVDAATLEGAKQTIAVGPVAARLPSRCSARTAAASSTPTPRTRSRTRRRWRTSCRSCRSSRSAPRSPTSSAAWSATSAKAGRSSP